MQIYNIHDTKTHFSKLIERVTAGEEIIISKAGVRFYRLGESIFDEDGQINRNIRFATLAAHVWFSETKTPWEIPVSHSVSTSLPLGQGEDRRGYEFGHNSPQPPVSGFDSAQPSSCSLSGVEGNSSPLLGSHNGVAYYLLFNGILGDKRPDGGNVLTSKVLALLPPHDGPKVIYGESCRLRAEKLKLESITLKQTPYDIKAR
jgi:adenine-specific DNA-methyltransferase